MLDTERIGYGLTFDIAKSFGYEMPNDLLLSTIGMSPKRAAEIYKQHFGNDFPADKIMLIKQDRAEQNLLKNGVPIKKGLVELLDLLEMQRIKKVVATSSYRKTAKSILAKAGILEKLDAIVCGDEVCESKPNPAIFLRAKETLNLPADELLILEDSRMGVLAAHKAGIKSIMIPDLVMPDELSRKLYFKEFSSLIEFKEYLSQLILNDAVVRIS